jgi:prepilin-type processing-associated H-X9-DG protein
MKSDNNLKQIGLALHGYHDTAKSFPPAYTWKENLKPRPPRIQVRPLDLIDRPPASSLIETAWPGWGWASFLLPHVEQAPLHGQINFTAPTVGTQAAPVVVTPLAVYACPSDSAAGVYRVHTPSGLDLMDAATNSYAACYGAGGDIATDAGGGNGLFQRNSKWQFHDIADGTSNTLAVAERAGLFVQSPWAGVLDGGSSRTTPGAPVYQSLVFPPQAMVMARVGAKPLNDPWSEPYDFFGPHPGMMNALFADGSVRPIRFSTAPDVFQALATRSGGEAVGLPE